MESENEVRFEIAIYGRGGQAAKTAGELLAHTLYRTGYSPHGQPRYTAERMGAPVSYAIRFHRDRTRIYDRSWIRRPQLVVVFDLSLIEQLDLTAALRPDVVVVANAAADASGLEALRPFQVARVDGNRIASEVHLVKGCVPIVSTVMAGAFARVSGLISLEDLLQTIRDESTSAVERSLKANLEAARRGYAEVLLPA